MEEPSQEEELSRARQAALRLLARRGRSSKELSNRLKDKGFSPETIRQTIERLEELGYLDDLRLARSLARYLLETRPSGRKRLAWELAQRGFPKELIHEALEEAYQGLDERLLALEVARRRLETYRDLKPQAARRRLAGYLQRRGFATEDILSILEELFPRET
jgi:regulatory protein